MGSHDFVTSLGFKRLIVPCGGQKKPTLEFICLDHFLFTRKKNICTFGASKESMANVQAWLCPLN